MRFLHCAEFPLTHTRAWRIRGTRWSPHKVTARSSSPTGRRCRSPCKGAPARARACMSACSPPSGAGSSGPPSQIGELGRRGESGSRRRVRNAAQRCATGRVDGACACARACGHSGRYQGRPWLRQRRHRAPATDRRDRSPPRPERGRDGTWRWYEDNRPVVMRGGKPAATCPRSARLT